MRAVILALFAAIPSAFAAPSKQPEPKAEAGASDSATEAADVIDAPDSARETAPPSAHREGEYGGVRPGGAGDNDASRRSKSLRKGMLSWIGFDAKDGGGDVFLQSPAEFELTQRVENGTLIVSLGGVSQLGQNTWRFIDTRFFDSPIARIVARRVSARRGTKASPPRSAGIEVRIDFKTKADAREATVRNSTDADGMYYAYLSFSGSPGT